MVAVERIGVLLQAELGLSRLATRLAALTFEYRALLDAAPTQPVFDTVRAARQRGLAYVRQVIAMVLGRYHDDTAAHRLARASPTSSSPRTSQPATDRCWVRGGAGVSSDHDHRVLVATPPPHLCPQPISPAGVMLHRLTWWKIRAETMPHPRARWEIRAETMPHPRTR